MSYRVRINGVAYDVTVVDGESVYDPPLPEESKQKYKNNLDDIFQTGKCPGLQTETSWSAGRGTLLDQMEGDENWTKHVVREAKKRGYTPGYNDIYLSQLADSPGDPKAFIKPSEGRARVAQVCRDNGLGCEGTVTVKPKPYDPKPACKLNPRIVKQMSRNYRRDKLVDSSVSDKELGELIVKTHGRQD